MTDSIKMRNNLEKKKQGNKKQRQKENKIQTQKTKERNRQNTEQGNEGWDKERNIKKEERFFTIIFFGENNTP